MRRAGAAGALLTVLAGGVAACGTGGGIGSGARVNVYVSVPLRGPSGPDGRDVGRGARMALADAGGRVGDLGVRAVYLDDTAGAGASARWSAPQVGRNARRATEDSTAIAYLGDFESGATRVSEPITNQATLLQVSPASSAVDLTRPFVGSTAVPDSEQTAGRTFGRVIPADDVQGAAAAGWMGDLGAKRVRVITDGSPYSKSVSFAFTAALGPGRVVKHGGDATFDARAGSTAHSGGATAVPGRRGPIVGTDALLPPFSTGPPSPAMRFTSAAQDPSQLPPPGQRFADAYRSHYGHAPGRYAAYGYEAMAVILDSIRRAGADGAQRRPVIDAFFHTADRRSVLGTYSIDPLGDTTLNRLTGYRLRGGRPVPAARLTAR